MKNRINLYFSEFQPPKDPLSLGRVVLIFCVALALMIVASYFAHAHMKKWSNLAYEAEQERAAAEEEAEALRTAAQSRKSDEGQKRRLENLKKHYESQSLLLDSISKIKADTDIAYSAFMADLARTSDAEVQITDFWAKGQKVDLAGKTLRPEAIPAMLERFKNAETLGTKSFSGFRIVEPSQTNQNAESDGLYGFELKGYEPPKINSQQRKPASDEEK